MEISRNHSCDIARYAKIFLAICLQYAATFGNRSQRKIMFSRNNV